MPDEDNAGLERTFGELVPFDPSFLSERPGLSERAPPKGWPIDNALVFDGIGAR